MTTSDIGKYMVFALYLLFNLLVINGNSNVNAVYPGTVSSASLGNEYSIDSMFIALLSNGDASIDYNLVIESNSATANITLFGQTVQNLTLTDYNGTSVQYHVTEIPEKIVVNTQPSSNIHVTYTTPDFVDKQNRNWTFSFSFDDKFLIKLPEEARIIAMEPQPYLTPTNEQGLWGFGPGNVKIQYVIGPLGTREEAQASILLVEESIDVAKKDYKGIVMNNVSNLVKQTKSLFNEGKYLKAVTNAERARTIVENNTNRYVVGQQAISQAETELQNKREVGYDTLAAERTLANAKSFFSQGYYDNASSFAKLAISQPIPNQNSVLSIHFGIVIGIIFGIILAILFILKRRTRFSNKITVGNTLAEENVNQQGLNTTNSDSGAKSLTSGDINTKSGIASSMPVNMSPIPRPEQDQDEIKDYLNQVVKEVNNVRIRAYEEKEIGSFSLQSSVSNEKEQIARQVAQMKMNKPYLRLEDKELLDFLVEKNGSAFESELRTKFILPRTSLWRLVKRLEREDLLDVRKIGGQNMISLKFNNTNI
jgi:uncharacterized membrane protein